MKKGQKVTLVGFGTFSVSKRKSRKGRNPRTGDVITIPAGKIPKFTAGKSLKDYIK
ncbi:MAG TPA: HU family DNA-binding protein [Thermodesulfovibrionales bacterium]|nr:HU family DNA-binding protein [Thermodesulfovibrionales bacterium]